MAVIKKMNFTFIQPFGIKSGDTVDDCNCTQREMNTPVCKGLTKLTVKNTNPRNCVWPPDTKFIGCKPYQKEIVPTPLPTKAELIDSDINSMITTYGKDIVKTEAKKILDLKENI